MPPKRRRRFQGIYYHSSPPKVLSMNGQISNGHDRKRKREVDDFSVKLSTIRIWMHEKDIGKLTRILWAGQGNRLRQQASTNSKVKRFLSAVPYVMNSIKDVHQAVIDNSLENLQSHLEPPVPPALVTCRDANGLNLIHKAAGLGHATILEYLIATWPDGVNETDITGKTPLHWAASAKNNMRCYTLLTQAGCDEEVLDYKMKTPTYYRHKPNEIERAFLTYVPDAPRVSPGIATDWEALSDDSGDGKKRDIKIPELNGFGRHSITESNENTSEAEVTEGLEQISEDNPSKNEESYVKEESAENANDPKAEEQSTNGNGEDQEASSEEVENTTEEINDPEEDNEEVKEEEQQSEKQSEIINDCIAGTVTKDPVGSQPREADENEENNDDDIENGTEVVASNEDTMDIPEGDMEQDKISEEKEEKEIDENVEDGVIKIDSKTEAPLHNELDQNNAAELVEKNEDSSGEDDADKNESNKEHEDENEDEAKSSDSDQEIKDKKLINIDQLSLPEDDKLDSEYGKHTSEDGLKDRENQKTEEDENNNTKDAETSEEELQEVLPERNELENKIDDDKEEGNENGIEIKEFVKEIETNLEMQIDEVAGYVKKAGNELKTALSIDKSDPELVEQSDIEAEDDSREVVIVNSENNSSKHDKAELNEKNYKDHFNMKNNDESENENESESEDDEETNNNNNNSDDKENGKELTENNESTDNETELNDRNNNQDDEQTINENGDENVVEEDAVEEKAVEEEATEEEATAEKAAEEEEVAKAEVIEHGDNEKNLLHENAERDSAVTPSLAIEGFVAGASEDNTVQSQTAAIDHNEKELQLQQIVAAGDMEKLAQIVLNGDGEKLSNLEAAEPEVQAFLNNVPNYMNKIQRVHKAARNGSLLSLQQALDRRKFAISRDNISPNGATPLHVATLFGHSDILRYLAFRFPETTSATDFDGRTPLHYAAVINDNGHFYNVLLKLGANPKIEDKLGKTAEQYRHDDKLRDILNYRQLLMPFNAEELESQLLSDQVPHDFHSSRRSLDDEDVAQILDRCFDVIQDSRKVWSGSNASALSHRKPLSGASSMQLVITSYLSRFLKPSVYEKIKRRQTRLDHNLFDVIWPALRKTSKERLLEEDINCGVIAPDFDIYVVFQEFMVPLIKDMQCMAVNSDFKPHPRIAYFPTEDGERLNTARFLFDDEANLVIRCTVECSRNLDNYELPLNLTVGQIEQVERCIMSKLFNEEFVKIAQEPEPGNYYTLTEVLEENSDVYQILEEYGLLIPFLDTRDVIQAAECNVFHGHLWPYGRGVYISASNRLALWLNCQEHLRVIATSTLKDPNDMGSVYTRIGRTVTYLEQRLHFKESFLLGYLQARPSYLGTGLKVTTILTLPNLMKEMDNLRHLCAVRGLHLTTSNSNDKIQVCLINMRSMGAMEYEIFQDYCTAVTNILALEKDMSLSNSKHIALMLLKIFRRKKTRGIET
uniref:Uncharacterized protein n=1 Tax=Glossina morsitans morsitans TaxID=37546 RepID=A0A1B0G1F3_GLOMM